jgi:uncharacterized protein YeaO (DUF488 family)
MENPQLAEWLKDLAPSPGLRTWVGHDPKKYTVFRKRHRAELGTHPELIDRLALEARLAPVTLLFAVHDAEHCNASILRAFLEGRLQKRGRPTLRGKGRCLEEGCRISTVTMANVISDLGNPLDFP